MRSLFAGLLRDERGGTAIEYGLIASLVVVVLLTGLTAVGTNADAMWAALSTALVSAMS